MYQISVMHQQENNSFASFDSALALAACKSVFFCEWAF